MAANTDPRAVALSNQKGRPIADLMYSTYLSCVAFIELWNGQQMGTIIPFDSNLIVDGATVNGTDATGGDGRPLITNAAMEQIFNFANNLVNVFERGTLDTSGTQNFANRTNVLAVQVNGRSIF